MPPLPQQLAPLHVLHTAAVLFAITAAMFAAAAAVALWQGAGAADHLDHLRVIVLWNWPSTPGNTSIWAFAPGA